MTVTEGSDFFFNCSGLDFLKRSELDLHYWLTQMHFHQGLLKSSKYNSLRNKEKESGIWQFILEHRSAKNPAPSWAMSSFGNSSYTALQCLFTAHSLGICLNSIFLPQSSPSQIINKKNEALSHPINSVCFEYKISVDTCI